MPVTNDNYDQLKIDKLKHYLETQAQRGHPRPFEVFVDNLKVVNKTEDPAEFDTYEFYMNEDTEKVRILIYNSNLSPRNDQYCFLVQRQKGDKSLNGLGEIEAVVQEKLAARDREHEMTRLREELHEAKQELEESEEYAEKLEREIDFLKENKFKLGNINIGELASVAVEGMIRRNPQILTRLPGGEALAGIIEQDTLEKQQGRIENPAGEQQASASFQRKSAAPELTETEGRQLEFLRGLQENFDQREVKVFNVILSKLGEDPSRLRDIAQILEINF